MPCPSIAFNLADLPNVHSPVPAGRTVNLDDGQFVFLDQATGDEQTAAERRKRDTECAASIASPFLPDAP